MVNLFNINLHLLWHGLQHATQCSGSMGWSCRRTRNGIATMKGEQIDSIGIRDAAGY
ncbi:hypothetical protein [Nitrosomonas sp.]|uniref:hypothetical protein n=1 Tax=Nitrosomonas sp. TaxID=42353 RepID=UPI0025ED00CD|nr:hypothetical protein [Nitrosomonas sp.]